MEGPIDQLTSANSLIIKQNYITTDYCCCCWTVDGKYYDIKSIETEDGKELVLRADEDVSGSSIFIKDQEGQMAIALHGRGYCPCGCFPGSHTRIDVHINPGGEIVGSIHYSSPSYMSIKDNEGEQIFLVKKQGSVPHVERLKAVTTSAPVLKTEKLYQQNQKFEVFSVHPDYPEVFGTISTSAVLKNRKEKRFGYSTLDQGFSVTVNYDPVLDTNSKAMVLGAAFPIGLEYCDDDDVIDIEPRSSKRSSLASVSKGK